MLGLEDTVVLKLMCASAARIAMAMWLFIDPSSKPANVRQLYRQSSIVTNNGVFRRRVGTR